jgi:DNA-binding transcriptional regulator YiaG
MSYGHWQQTGYRHNHRLPDFAGHVAVILISYFGIFKLTALKEQGSDFSQLRGSALKSSQYLRHYRAFLRRLKQAREDAHLTQVEVARRLSKPQSFVSKFESGERRVDFVELQYLARIYKKPLAYFQVE